MKYTAMMLKEIKRWLTNFSKMVRAGTNACAASPPSTYEDAIRALNDLQTNAAYRRNAKKQDSRSSDTLRETRKYIQRSGLSLKRLNELSIIHVAGTKGKGSTCAFAESVLRAHGLRTGLYTSPHLVTVRERLRINGKPIDEEKFTKYFWELYEILRSKRDSERDMPLYFKFLTIMMFHVFTREPIDVAIIEVGIGGEFDCTNVIGDPVCVGITSLGLEHTSLLGDTMEDIAFQKSGIMKRGTTAFTVPQAIEAMRIIEERAREKSCALGVVSPLDSYPWPSGEPPILGISGDFQSHNASMAVSLSRAFVNSPRTRIGNFSLELASHALSSCRWPGRMQTFHDRGIDFHLDGAHTVESMKFCVSWYRESTEKMKISKRILIFNTTGERDPSTLLSILRCLDFHRVFFVPNIAGKRDTVDQANYTISDDERMLKCRNNRDTWGPGAVCAGNVGQVIDDVRAQTMSGEKVSLLVTGSLHLVGAALAILDPDLTRSTKC